MTADHSVDANNMVGAEVRSEVNADIAASRFEPYDWQRSLSAAVAAHAEKTARRQAERAELKRRRDYGLARRHANKLNRNATSPTVGQRPTDQHEEPFMDREQIAQETAEYIAAHAPAGQPTDGIVIRYIGEQRPPTAVADIKAALLQGKVWTSWMDDIVFKSMREMGFTPEESAR